MPQTPRNKPPSKVKTKHLNTCFLDRVSRKTLLEHVKLTNLMYERRIRDFGFRKFNFLTYEKNPSTFKSGCSP